MILLIEQCRGLLLLSLLDQNTSGLVHQLLTGLCRRCIRRLYYAAALTCVELALFANFLKCNAFLMPIKDQRRLICLS